MTTDARMPTRLEAARREQTPQALARLTVICLFIVLWFVFLAASIPMPTPFLVTLCAEAAFFLVYWRSVQLLRTVRGIGIAHACMLAAEICFHTTMVYFLGGATWLGAFAYVFGLVFANTFLGLRAGAVYTTGAAAAFVSLALLDATDVIPHYSYLDPRPDSYADPQFVATTIIAGAGVFFSLYLWVNWVGHQLRLERDGAVRMRDQLFNARAQLQRQNADLEDRVRSRTVELEAANVLLRARDELLDATIESTADGIVVFNKDGRAELHNARFAEMWHVPREVLDTRDRHAMLESILEQLADPGAFLSALGAEDPAAEAYAVVRFKDGRVFERYRRPLQRAGVVERTVLSFRDITEREHAAEQLRSQAQRDALTGAYNHAAIADRLTFHAADGVPVAVLMFDVDGMKAVNDTFGHQAGDRVLAGVAAALGGDGAEVGRYGGDEFLVLLPGFGREQAERYCERVMQQLSVTPVLDEETGSRMPLQVSGGVAVYPGDSDDPEAVVRLADAAMYAAKRRRVLAADGMLLRTRIEDERTARILGELVPILTAPGNLDDKLDVVARRLAEGAGYELVRFAIGAPGETRGSTFTAVDPQVVRRFEDEHGPYAHDRLIFDLLRDSRRPVLIDDLAEDARLPATVRDAIRAAGLRCGLFIPLLAENHMVGVLSVATGRATAMQPHDVQLLCAIADQVTAIVRMDRLVVDLQEASSHLQQARADTVVLLAASAEAHDQETGRHLQRVRAVSELLAAELGHDADEARAIGLAAVLHDIGKIRVPEAILLSPSQLSDDEWSVMKQHTVWGAEFLRERPGFELAAAIAAAHHERWDGSGYPGGLTGDEIPEAAAIVAVADSLDAITSDRPYRAGRPLDWAVHEIQRCGGAQFSPRVVDALLRLHERRALPYGRPSGRRQRAA